MLSPHDPALTSFLLYCLLPLISALFPPLVSPEESSLKSSQQVEMVVRAEPQQKLNPSSIAKKSMFCISGRIQIH